MRPTPREAAAVAPRLLDRDGAAAYLGVSSDTIDRLVARGVVSVVRLPAARARNGAAVDGPCRRILIDRAELDGLVTTWRERRS